MGDKEAANVQPKGEIREVSMGLRWKAVKGRAHPLTRLSLGAPVPSCWTELSERTEEPEREAGRKRVRERERQREGGRWATREYLTLGLVGERCIEAGNPAGDENEGGRGN